MTTPYGIAKNKATYGYNGWQAEMVYCLAAQDVAAFIAGNYLDEYAARRKWPSWRSSTSRGWTATSSTPPPASPKSAE